MSKEPLFREAAAAYAFGGKILSIAPFGSGHINDTYRVVCPDGAYILQRINGFVFHHPDAIMENMLGVTRFLAAKLAAQGGDPARGTL
ncbi:MAG: mucin desulfatase, partial [Acutalibacteraceae bacterium]|nr:mucin desulfatase [Acutalibacteraceae bacterium]